MGVHDISGRRAGLAQMLCDLREPWVIGVVQPAQEFKCERILSQLKIIYYCPAKVIESRGGVRHTIRRQLQPAFPRYMFLSLSPGEYVQLERLHPFQGVVRMEGKPLALTLKVLRDVAERELAGGFDQLIMASDSFQVGDRVEVQWETLTMQGIIERLVGRRKAIIDISTQRVTVPVAQLARVC